MTANAFVDFLLDQLEEVPDVRAQPMFGGRGLYSGDVFFGIVFKDILYFKVNHQSRDDYVRAGMSPFKPYKDRPMTMQYYEVPATVIEDVDELCRWARRAIAASVDRKATSPVKRAGRQRRARSPRRK
jgi:DNA transformation protein and related proteins